MSFSIGIIGLPNVGKSTLFKALTKKQVDISNYPFCTINPNVGVVAVPDERLDKLAEILKPEKVIPTTIEFVDIAGLVKNAHKGEGLGNQFLSHIREVKAIVQVVRDFKDENVAHVAGKVDAKSDIETVNLELIFADLATVDKRISEVRPKAKSGEKEAKELMPILEKLKAALEQGKLAGEIELSDEVCQLVNDLHLLTMKPMLYVYNIDEPTTAGSSKSSDLEKPEPRSEDLGVPLGGISTVNISAKLEAELADLSEEEAREYMKEVGLKESGLDKLIKASYKLLDLITFFTTQSNILQAWTVRNGTKAPQSAGVIHTDFEKGFIRAEVINWQEFVQAGGEHQAREKGLLRTEGKDYIVQDGDVVHFLFK